MRGRHDFDESASEIEAAVGAALDHAFEFLAHALRPEVTHRNIEPAVRRRVPLADLAEHRARHEVAGRALGFRVVGGHEPFFISTEKKTPRAAQSLFEHRARHARVGTREQACRVELDHFHVAQC